jgi:lactoylglutathione lyase
MENRSTYNSVFPIGDTDPQNLPVGDLETSVAYYREGLGFAVKSRSASPHKSAVLLRDAIEIGLAENGGDPEQASCYIGVSDVDLARQELSEKGLEPSAIRIDEHNGKTYRVFFLRAPDGLCYCFGQQQ